MESKPTPLPQGWVECNECRRPVKERNTYRLLYGPTAHVLLCEGCHEDAQRRDVRRMSQETKMILRKG